MDIIRQRIGDLRSSNSDYNAKPVLPINHNYDFILVDAQTAHGIRFICKFDSIQEGVLDFSLRPGQLLPVTKYDSRLDKYVGRALYMSANLYEGLSGSVPTSRDNELVTIFALKASEAIALQLRPQHGDLLHNFSANITNLAAGSEQVILDSDSFVQLNGLPLTLKIKAVGGQMSSITDFPMELILREYDDGASDTEPSVMLFPGDAVLQQVLPLMRNTRRSSASGDSRRWRLSALNPTGSNAAKSGSIIGEIVCGNHEPSTVLHGFGKVETSPPADTSIRANVAYTVDHVPNGNNINGTINNGSAAGTFEYRHNYYIPSVFGGPYLYYATSLTAAFGANATISTAPGGRWMTGLTRYQTAPTTPSYRIHLALGGKTV